MLVQGWSDYVASHRCSSLLSPFLAAGGRDSLSLFLLWGEALSFCAAAAVNYTTAEGEEATAANPFEGPRGFCEAAELLHAADIFDVETSLPQWAAAAAAAAAAADAAGGAAATTTTGTGATKTAPAAAAANGAAPAAAAADGEDATAAEAATVAAQSLKGLSSAAAVLPYLQNPRLQAFIQWLEEDVDESDSDE